MKAIIITIGDELLIGQVNDTNSTWIAEQCTIFNIEVIRKITISDGLFTLHEVLDENKPKADLFILTGGLGPTSDDYTAEALTQYFGMNTAFHQPTWERIESYFIRRGRIPSDSLKKQAMLPVEIEKLQNDLGTAPGLYHTVDDKIYIALPGVPYEMKHLFTDRFLPLILPLTGEDNLVQRTLLTCGKGETDLADLIRETESLLPDHISIAYLPDVGKVRLRISGKGPDKTILTSEIKAIGDRIISQIGDCYYGEGKTHLVNVLKEIFVNKGMTLGLAESCTGGHISDQIVSYSGASSFYNGGIVSYSNEAKHNVLGVSLDDLEKYGAVSEAVVKQMAEGVRKLLQVDVAASISGIAGPEGGSDEKPVGTFWLGLSIEGRDTQAIKIYFNRDRQRNIEFITTFVLNQIRLNLS